MPKENTNRSLLKTSLIGTVVTGLCCFTPVLMLLLEVVGLLSIAVYLDYVLLPLFAIFICITIYALIRRYQP